MPQEKRMEMILEYARKVAQYPKGSKGYDPVDLINLQDAIRRHDKEQLKSKLILN